MNFLWLTRFPPYPPLQAGVWEYSRSLVESLARAGRVEALAFREPTVAAAEIPGLTWHLLPARRNWAPASIPSLLPNVTYRNVDRAYLARAVEMAADKDAIFVDHIAMAWIVEPLIAALGTARPPVIAITHNDEQTLRAQMATDERSILLRPALYWDAWKAGRIERRANRAADGITTITEADAAAFAARIDRPLICVPPSYNGEVIAERCITAQVPMRVCIPGNRTSYHKVMVLERTLAALSGHGVQDRLDVDIVGSGDLGPFARKYPGFNYIGFVDDLFAYFRDVRLGLVTDVIGGGFKIRAMTLAFARVPMLALRNAMDGMGFVDGKHYVGVDTLDELAELTPRLAENIDRLNALQQAAFEDASERFDSAVPGRLLRDFARRLADARRGTQEA